MEIAVLVKAVPRSEQVRYDEARRSLLRDGVELVLNPFDQRALRVALELRRPDEHVTVVSLGPPAVRALLRETCAVGADRALHLCDPAFAGSDILATSAALHVALRSFHPELIVAGARSTDSDTGLVGPEVAGRLGIPVVTAARAIRRPVATGPMEVDVDTAVGGATVEVGLPVLVTVGEKIAKPLTPSAEQFDRTPVTVVRTLGAAALGLSEAEVGAFGSPTVVTAVRAVSPPRLGRRFSAGSVTDRVGEALSVLAPLLAVDATPVDPLPWPHPVDADQEVVVLASDVHGAVEATALELIAHLRRKLASFTVAAALYGPDPPPPERARLERAGALAGYALSPNSGAFDSADVAGGLSVLLDLRPRVTAVVIPASRFGREVAGQLAAHRSLGAVGDATEVEFTEDRELTWWKPSFGGGTLAAIRCRSRPVVATMPSGMVTGSADPRGLGRCSWTSVATPSPRSRVRTTHEHAEPFEGPEPSGADVVVAVGTGVGGPEGIRGLLPTVARWHAALVGTRRVVDAGWLPVRRQVGLTGALLAPRLAVLLGVRGAANHMVGWTRASAVLAVNHDPAAPVFAQADVGIVGPVEEVVPDLAAPLERLLVGSAPPRRPA